MELAYEIDVFFDLRADDSWAAAAPRAEGEAPAKSLWRAFVLSRFARRIGPTQFCSKPLAEEHPELAGFLRRTIENNDGKAARLSMEFRRRYVAESPAGEPRGDELEKRLSNAESSFATTFARMFAETCPASISWTQASADHRGLVVVYDFAWAPAGGVDVTFDVLAPAPMLHLHVPPPIEGGTFEAMVARAFEQLYARVSALFFR